MHVRTDILAALGNPPINSVEDFLNVLKMVKAKYPNMIGFLPLVTWGSTFAEDVGLPSSSTAQYRMSNGRVTLAFLAPAMADFLKIDNQFFRNNYTPAEALTYKYEQFLQVVRSGNVFSAVYNAPFSDEQNRFFEDNKIPGTWKPISKPLTVGGQMKFHPVNSSFMGWSGLFITKNTKKPDRAIRLYEYLKSDAGDQLAQWGIPDKQWTLTADGYLQRPADFLTMEVAKAGVGPNYGLWCFGASGLREGIINASVALSDPKHATSLDALRARKPFYVRDPDSGLYAPCHWHRHVHHPWQARGSLHKLTDRPAACTLGCRPEYEISGVALKRQHHREEQPGGLHDVRLQHSRKPGTMHT